MLNLITTITNGNDKIYNKTMVDYLDIECITVHSILLMQKYFKYIVENLSN